MKKHDTEDYVIRLNNLLQDDNQEMHKVVTMLG